MSNAFNTPIIEEFRANRGQVGGGFEGARLLLLTTTGARTGALHTVPLGYLPDGGERVLVIGSAGGGPHHPAWFHNLRADPRATVEDGVFTYAAEATILDGAERDSVFARAAGADPGWAAYQDATTRVLPVVALSNVRTGPPNVAADSPGAALRLIHDAFRRELALIRSEVATAGPALGAQLRVNCLTLCAGLRNHHGGEDAAMFPFLDLTRPDLAPVVDRLRYEHEQIAVLVARLQEAIAAGGAGVTEEVDRLATDLERHLAYEEEQLIPVLDGAAAR
ncbi:nitroreductase/quinone reductase family protein [Pseudonocardia abyssalis]|uniref:Nitroreductase family deazaflavin-dependent oxidoreductase n=1 Tax=Pseudonocardia abyssalis TaxID=2792008 RepID=A0ABS6UV77_9PSEU|nr:nitroreductase/quinone reductase family protein [Pseudonocardia abyssalis]MBW0117784.1 nitroreductase family deazaflavin-dependent oxidoreductase [Pseudonocardia abyssalis]MBW0136137.1 nitroreductase family deazaflavin-dependent oxidoreductase [Pseudonocardia abyssalis]